MYVRNIVRTKIDTRRIWSINPLTYTSTTRFLLYSTSLPFSRSLSYFNHNGSSSSSPLTLPSTQLPYHRPTETDIQYFKQIIGEHYVYTDTDTLQTASTDWLKQYVGKASVVLRPNTTEQISLIMKYCYEKYIPVVPQGGNTGLVGGGVPLDYEVVLKLDRLNTILSVDAVSGGIIVQSGCILQNVDTFIQEKYNLTIPLDLGSKGSCQIGGNVSTNAGGLRLLRYGSLHGSVLGLEIVLPNGTILNTLTTLRKDNVGFDIKQLFIGSEGTLGIITAVAIQAVPRPSSINVAMFGVDTFQNCLELFKNAKKFLGEILSAVEFVDKEAMNITLRVLFPDSIPTLIPNTNNKYKWNNHIFPLETLYPYHVVIETAGSSISHDQDKLQKFLEYVLSENIVSNGVVAADIQQAKHLWRLREDVSVAITKRGHVFKYDISFNHNNMYDIVPIMKDRLSKKWLEKGVIPVGYGHLGDGNLHLNISTPDRQQLYLSELEKDIEPYIFDYIIQNQGSISAEHGMGQAKSNWLTKAKSKDIVNLMYMLKQNLDPRGILNPGKVLPIAKDE